MSGYLDFKYTGVKEVDDILAALESAGSGYHNTSQWDEKEDGEQSYIEMIQEAADKCADKMKKLATSDNSECTVTQSEIASPKLTS